MTDRELQGKNFFASLFDFSFTSFITLRFLRVLYALVMVVIVLYAIATIAIFSKLLGAVGFVVGLLVAGLFGLLYLIVVRISLELIALFFRIGQNTTTMAESLRGGTQMSVVSPALPVQSTAALPVQSVSAAAPPGWYPDGSGSTQWWDGTAWTGMTQ